MHDGVGARETLRDGGSRTSPTFQTGPSTPLRRTSIATTLVTPGCATSRRSSSVPMTPAAPVTATVAPVFFVRRVLRTFAAGVVPEPSVVVTRGRPWLPWRT